MGVLYVVATPIGNLEDITLRALRVLREVHLIAAEDTRTTAKLLSRHGIQTPLLSFFEHNEVTRQDEILDSLESHDVALVSEAGVPTVSDPGYRLVKAAIERGIQVVPVPGASAVLSALCASGLPTDSFVFLGFLPRRRAARQRLWAAMRSEPRTLVCFEAPHRLLEALEDMEQVLGARQVVIACELTKMFEHVWRGTATEAVQYVRISPARGEYTLVVQGADEATTELWTEEQVVRALDASVRGGASRKDAAAQVAAQARWSKRAVYAIASAMVTNNEGGMNA